MTEAEDALSPTMAVEEMMIVNEFAAVRVRKVHTPNGERLELYSLKQDRTVRIDALSLESLTWRSVWDIGAGLETPIGPEDRAVRPEGIEW